MAEYALLDPRTEQTINKAVRFLNTATAALESGDSESAVSRAYYALYHITILLLRAVKGIERERWDHEQLHRAFLDQFCEVGYRFSRRDGRDWEYVKNSRIAADYHANPLSSIRGQRAIERARQLIEAMMQRIKDNDQAR